MKVILLENMTDRRGRKYPVDNWKTEYYGELGGDGSYDLKLNLENISHKISNVRIEENHLVGELKFLDTPTGNIASELHNSGVILNTSIRAVGLVGSDMTVEDLEVFGFDITVDSR